MHSIPMEDLAMIEDLNRLRKRASEAAGYFPVEHGGPYGALKEALILSIASGLVNGSLRPMFFGGARAIAEWIYDEAVNNGESIAYNLALFNEGVSK